MNGAGEMCISVPKFSSIFRTNVFRNARAQPMNIQAKSVARIHVRRKYIRLLQAEWVERTQTLYIHIQHGIIRYSTNGNTNVLREDRKMKEHGRTNTYLRRMLPFPSFSAFYSCLLAMHKRNAIAHAVRGKNESNSQSHGDKKIFPPFSNITLHIDKASVAGERAHEK